eukprot:scaffold323488_cov17-Prasinocladus_malaysianus.AAC.1
MAKQSRCMHPVDNIVSLVPQDFDTTDFSTKFAGELDWKIYMSPPALNERTGLTLLEHWVVKCQAFACLLREGEVLALGRPSVKHGITLLVRSCLLSQDGSPSSPQARKLCTVIWSPFITRLEFVSGHALVAL